jgi:ketosteroid isomerase-like protein
MKHDEAKTLIETYGKAWETKDVELISSIFNAEASYNDPREKENIGLTQIQDYWKYKVVGGQDDIKFSVKHIWVDGDTIIAEWNATFKDIPRQLFIDMDEVAIIMTENGKISSLREYYKNTKTPLS